MSVNEWVTDPPHFSLSYNNSSFSHCGRLVVVVGACGGPNRTVTTARILSCILLMNVSE